MQHNPLFQFHRLNSEGLKKVEMIAHRFTDLLNELRLLCPPGRELSLVQTKLEEASFFAKKAVANVSGNQE